MRFKKDSSVKSLKKELEALKKLLKKVEEQTPQDCEKGKHLTRGFATGGSSGHYVTYCLCCDYREDGYD